MSKFRHCNLPEAPRMRRKGQKSIRRSRSGAMTAMGFAASVKAKSAAMPRFLPAVGFRTYPAYARSMSRSRKVLNTSFRLAAHGGAGILRVAVTELSLEGGGLERWVGALAELRGRLEVRGGSLTLSRAPRPLVSEVGAWGKPGPEGALLEGIKRELDPRGILAPGRFVV